MTPCPNCGCRNIDGQPRHENTTVATVAPTLESVRLAAVTGLVTIWEQYASGIEWAFVDAGASSPSHVATISATRQCIKELREVLG